MEIVGAIAGLIAAILACALIGASFWMWILFILIGPIIGMVMIGMVS